MKYNDWILQTLSDSFQNAEKRHGTIRWQSVEDKREKKEKKEKERGKKKKKREKWGKMTTIYSLSFPFSFLFLSLFSSFSWSSLPFSLSKRQERERERVRRKRGEEEGKRRKGKRVYCCHLPLLSFFLLFIFPSLLSFFLSSLSLASLTRQAWRRVSLFKRSEAVSQKR